MPRATKLAGHAIEQHDSPNRGGSMSAHRGVVLHIAEGTYRGTISWQNNPNQRYSNGQSVTTCSTWIVGRAEGEWAQMVDSNRIAWCQRDGSRTWLSIELAGYAPSAPTAWQIEACAQLLAWAHRIHGIPVAIADHPGERGLGHHSMDREWLGEEWGHDSCPGSGVVAAKSAIVTRARAILAGEDVRIMAALTDAEQAELLKGMRSLVARKEGEVSMSPTVVTRWAQNPKGVEQLLHIQALAEIRALAQAAAGKSADQIVAEIRADGERTRAALAAQPEAIAAAVVAALPGDRDDVTADELAEALREVLRDGVLSGADLTQG